MPSKVTFSLLLPTRQRTERLRRFLDSLAANTANPEQLEVVLVVDTDDLPSIEFRYDSLAIEKVIVLPGQPMGALNQAAYEASRGEFVMLLNDDVVVRTPGWDTRVLAQFRRVADGILLVHVNDTLMRQNLCTFPIVSRKFCEIAGGICPREYVRYRIDDHIEDAFNLLFALGQRRTVYLPEVVFEHLNAVVMPEGHSEYHAEPETLTIDAARFDALFSTRKELALRLMTAIEGETPPHLLAERRRVLDTIADPFALRTPSRQRVHWDHPLRARLRHWVDQWRRAGLCLREKGIRGLAAAMGRRLLAQTPLFGVGAASRAAHSAMSTSARRTYRSAALTGRTDCQSVLQKSKEGSHP